MAKKQKDEKPKYFPIHPKLYPVIRAYHKIWFGNCKCEYCETKK